MPECQRPGLQFAIVPTPYFTLVREMKSPTTIACAWSRTLASMASSVLLVFSKPPLHRAKWLRRYQQQGPRGLIELSSAPPQQPGKTPADVDQQVVALRQQLFAFDARRLIREFDLPLSHRALERICCLVSLLMPRVGFSESTISWAL